MAGAGDQPATNARIVRLLEDVKAALEASAEREERIARDLERLLAQR